MIAAIHQPNFFPWLGYFNKIARSDVFILLDDVQYQKTGSSWSNRVKLQVSGEARWVTAPVRRPNHGTARIDELAWFDGPWREKLLRTLAASYAAAPFYSETMQVIQPLVLQTEGRVAPYNLRVIRGICEALHLRHELVLASSFGVDSASNERLIALCRHVGCSTYLAGGGATDYQQDGLFADAGIEVRYQEFRHPRYPQCNAIGFQPGLSIVDALMNCGVEGTRAMVVN